MEAVDRACGRFNLGTGEHCKDEACLAALALISRLVAQCAKDYAPFPAPAAIDKAQAACAK